MNSTNASSAISTAHIHSLQVVGLGSVSESHESACCEITRSVKGSGLEFRVIPAFVFDILGISADLQGQFQDDSGNLNYNLITEILRNLR